VEDDARQLEAMTELLSRPGIEIEGARSGMEALELIGRTHVDVVVMDLGFAGLSGIDLVRRVRAALPPRSTIVIYTGRELDGGAKRDLGALADRVISKGARSPARLMKALDALLGGEQGDYPGPADRGKGSEGQPRLAGRRVLLIDDDERNVFAIRCALEERGIEVVAGMNGREGLSELMRDPDIDLVLLDIMMPEMDGYGVMAEIRGNPATCCLPVIALTANALKGDSERCVAAGADDWLSKPVSVERLLSLLGQWMR
jgi:CheY-like chemotaxis protein